MADRTTPFRNLKDEADERINRVRTQIDDLVDALDFSEMSDKVQKFGKQNPIALALAAMTVGVAAGILMRKKID